MTSFTPKEWEIFPLGKAMPLETVLSFFSYKYEATVDKGRLMKNSAENKRLREGYWGMFACAMLDELEGRRHTIVFPLTPENDLWFLSRREGAERLRSCFNKLEFDVKEYTSYSKSDGFLCFIETILKPRGSTYGLIVGIHEDIPSFDPSLLVQSWNSRGVFLVSSYKGTDSPYVADVAYFIRGLSPIRRRIDLTSRLNIRNSGVIYDDILIERPS